MPCKASAILLSILILTSGTFAAKTKVETPQGVGLKLLYNFQNNGDGGAIFGGVARDRQGNLYGVTEIDDQDHGYGTLFELTPGRRGYAFHILAHFSESTGTYCEATPIVDDAGNVFGVCTLGGAGHGTLWEYSHSGKFILLHSFSGPGDGMWPDDLVLIGSDIYGTTAEWGSGSGGTFWKYSPRSQKFTLLHSFANGTDGGSPGGPTIDHKGLLWGITVYGPNCYDCGDGTVWNYDPRSGTFTTVLDFSSTGISTPQSNFIVDQRGNLYGTAFPNGGSNFGMIYELEADNNYAPVLLYTFTDKQNGVGPGQISFDQRAGDRGSSWPVEDLVGTTYLGGEFGDGTIYELEYEDGGWQEVVLHSFDGSDGSSPLDGMVPDHKGNWFGTTVYGGNYGWGEVFEMSELPVLTDWNQFHKHNMHRFNPYEKFLTVNNVGNLGLKWSFTANNGVYSSPTVVNGVVYVGSSDRSVYALNAHTGAKLWSYPTGNAVFSVPAVMNGVVYVGSWDGSVYALDAATGTKLWSYATGGEVTSSPAVANGLVYVGTQGRDGRVDGAVDAIDSRTGAKVWSHHIGSPVLSSPAVANGVVYVDSWNDYTVYALNARTGAKLWSYTTGYFMASSPAVIDGAVYVGSTDDNVYALDATTGAELWNYATGGSLESSPAVANGVVYVGSDDQKVYALDASTGARLWSYTTGGPVGYSSPAVANGVAYVGSHDGNVYALDATTGAELWSYPVGGSVDSSPTVVNGVVYVGSGYPDNKVYAFSLKHGPE